MSLINIKNLTFAYDGSYDNIFENVSFQIDTDWKLGFSGRNGRGKTTFVNLLLGKYNYQGSIQTTVTFDFFPFEIGDISKDTLTVVDETLGRYEYWQLCRELSLLGMDDEVLFRPFETLSHGERTKIMLAILFLKDNRFLLIDEPTNHLDIETRAVVSQYLNRKKGFILISHDRAFLDSCIDHILSINKTCIEIQKGNFSSWHQNKAYQDQHELNENNRIEKDIDRLKKSALRTAGLSDKLESAKIGSGSIDRGYIGHKSAKMMKRSKAIELRRNRAIDEKSKLLKNLESCEPIELFHLNHFQENLIEISNLSIKFNENEIIKGLNLNIKQGERIIVGGKNGSGKSTLLKALLGNTVPSSGTIKNASGLIISYIPQDTSFLKGDLKEYALECGIDPSLLLSILRKLDFNRIQFEKDMSVYSAGQKKKVLLARSICERAHLYIWDEPLNYIDVLSRIQIEEMILRHSPSMILVEHDSTFVETIGTTFIFL